MRPISNTMYVSKWNHFSFLFLRAEIQDRHIIMKIGKISSERHFTLELFTTDNKKLEAE